MDKDTVSYKNIEMEQMLVALMPLLERRDMIGYAAARNTRILQNEAKEYLELRDSLIRKYGKTKEDGEIELRFDSPEFASYESEITEWAMIEHTPKLFTVKYEEAIGKLSGKELLELEWMFED